MSLAALASFWGLCVAQGAFVLLPGVGHGRRLGVVRRHWLLFAAPVAVVVGATYIPAVAARLAPDLSLLAVIAVPPLAAAGVAWAMRWHDMRFLGVVPLLLAAAWSAPGGALGEAAALLLVGLSCVGLAVFAVAVLPSVALRVGILVWAAADLGFALAQDLADSSHAISGAAPAVAPGLVRLQFQRVVIGESSIEYADLFVAATLGAILVAESREQGPAAFLVAVFAMSLAPFFWLTDVVPGTVPVALALLLVDARGRRRSHP